jgi:S-adenosylmethionine decarboxylase
MPTRPRRQPAPRASLVDPEDVADGRRTRALDEERGYELDTERGHEAAADPAGCEWVVEARGCDPTALADLDLLKALFRRIVDELDLNEVHPSVWHAFPEPGGVTGMSLLAESHLTCHTFPEHGTACLNLFCCRPRPEWDFRVGLADTLGAEDVDVRRLPRRYGPTSSTVG